MNEHNESHSEIGQLDFIQRNQGWGESSGGFIKQVGELLLTAGSNLDDLWVRGTLSEDQVGPMARQLERGIRMLRRRIAAGDKTVNVPENLRPYLHLPAPMLQTQLTLALQTAVAGQARAQALSGIVGQAMRANASRPGMLDRLRHRRNGSAPESLA